MFLITSAAYISPGLASEFGKLPPCMLPVQNKRLYEHQRALVPSSEMCVLSLPKSYKLTTFDRERLAALRTRVVHVPDEFSLGQSIVYVLNVIGNYDEPLRILHGDTLFSMLDESTNICAVAKAEDGYEWASAGLQDKRVYSGYFSFSNQSLLIQKITECGYKFIQGLEEYAKEISITYKDFPNWMDFSFVNSYYRSISKLTTQRVFNSMKVSRYSVRKSSRDKQKMEAEANWLMSLPVSMKHYAPSVWDKGVDGDSGYYEIEYYFLSSLANLYVFGRNKSYVWEEIVDACATYLNDEASFRPMNLQEVASKNDHLYAEKTLQRLGKYCEQVGMSLDNVWTINEIETPSLNDIVKEIGTYISKQDARFATLMHGDPCFSNILYDFKSKSIKVIDPRGINSDGNIDVYGDFRYDVAKLAHSILGMYDYIIGGMYEYSEHSTYNVSLSFETNEVVSHVQEYFCSKTYGGYTLKELSTYPIMIHLFLSMLPLHHDHPERQKVMLANALRLYVELKKQY